MKPSNTSPLHPSQGLLKLTNPIQSLKAIALTLALVLAVAVNGAWGQKTYVGANFGNWNVAANWSPAGVPGVGDVVVFNNQNLTININVATANVGKLQLTNSNIVLRPTGGNRTFVINTNANDALVIENGSTLDITSYNDGFNRNITLTFAAGINSTQTIAGYFKTTTAGGTFTFNQNNTGFVFTSTASYEHARNGGAIPIATWDSGSTCLVTGIAGTALTSIGTDVTFGNFIWDCPGQTVAQNLTTGARTIIVQNDFSVLNTNNRNLNFTNSNNITTLTIYGSLTVGNGTNNAIFNIKNDNNNNANTVSIGGDLTVSSSATLTKTGTGTATSFNFGYTGATSEQNVIISGGGTFTNTYINYIVTNSPANKTVNLQRDIAIPAGRTFTVNTGATINCGSNNIISGAGTFALNLGATLITANPNGVMAAGASGSIQTTTRTLNIGANYVYNGTVAQVMGTGPTTMNNLTINNPEGVSLSRDIVVNGNFEVEEGATLDVLNYEVTGTGTFNLNTGTTLITANAGGIATAGATGSIRSTGARSYSSTANYTYNGTAAQVTGTGLPSTVNSLTINNSSATGVTLSNAVTVVNALNLNGGNLYLNGNNLTLSPSATIAGGPFSSTRMIDIGTSTIVKEGNANSDFVMLLPIGIGASYTPVDIASFVATSIAPGSTVSLQSSATPATDVPGTNPLNRHWVTSTSGFTGSLLADIRFTYLPADIPVGGQPTLYEIVYKPNAGEWGMPLGSSGAGINPLRASATNTLDAIWTATEPEKRTFYSLRSGNWDDPTTWTFDPSGALPLNPDNLTPSTSTTSDFDEVVVLSGRTVTVSSPDKKNSKLTVIGTVDFGSTSGHSFTILGSGRIRLANDNFPAGDATHFVTQGQGEGTVEYYGANRDLITEQAYYNLEVNMDTGSTLTLLCNKTVNGNLTVTAGTLRINNNSETSPLSITTWGDVSISANGSITTGTANARHQLNLYGNFTNNGEVRFTNRSVADYYSEAADGIVDVNFINTTEDQNLICKGLTNFYRIKIDKGSTIYNLNIDANTVDNFSLLGFANENHNLDIAQLTDNLNALGLVTGSVRIGNRVEIPALSMGNFYSISEGAQLWIDQGTVQKNTNGAIAIYGKLKTTNGLLEVKNSSGIELRNNGVLSIEGGVVNVNQLRTSDVGSNNYGGYIQSAGTLNVLGGSTNTDYYVFSLPYPQSVFNMSGGTLRVNTSTGNGAILINSNPENSKVTGGTVIAETNTSDDFIITTTAPFWNLQLRNSTANPRWFSLGAASGIGVDNINVDAQPLRVLKDFRIWGKESGGISYAAISFVPGINDVYIGGSFYIENGANYLPLSGGSAPYDSVGDQPTDKNTTHFIKSLGTAYYEQLYNGNSASPLEFGNIVVDRTSGYELRLTSSASRLNETVILDINGSASILSGTLNQNLFTIRTWGAIVNQGRMGTYTAGVTPSRAQIQIVENPALSITTTSNAVFGNIQINVAPPARITLTSDVYIERMEYVKGLIYIKNHILKVDEIWNLNTGIFENVNTNSYLRVLNNGHSDGSMIFTDGRASDGGLSLKIRANTQAENTNNRLNNMGPITFPIGFTPNGGTTLYFRPAQMVVKDFADDGYITIRPVLGALQTTNLTGGEVLQHYWRVSHSGFDIKPTVAYRFYYRNQIGTANVDLPAGSTQELNYVPGKVLDENPYTRQFETTNDIIRSFGDGSNSRFITLNGTSINGLFTPAVSGITLENANYTAGQQNRFTGSVLIFYSIDNNNVDGNRGAPWNRAASWTRSDLLNPSLSSPHHSEQPRSTTIPGAGNVVVIGWVPWDDSKTTVRGQPHCIWLTDTRDVAEVVFTQMTDDVGNPVPRVYRSNFQYRPTLTINGNGDVNTYDNDGLPDNGRLTAKLVKGEGLFWNRQSDPDYTIMDIGDFARQDSSYVIYENFTNGRIINNTPPLFPNLYISNDNWGANNHNFTFSRDLETSGNVELLGNVNLLLPTGASGNITVGRNLIMFVNQNSGSGAEIGFGNTGTARRIIVKGDLIMANANSIINVRAPNTGGIIVDHELHIYGNIVQGTATFASTGLRLWTAANEDRITLFLSGNNSMTYNLVNGTIPQLYRLVISKGNSISTTAQFNSNFTLNGPTTGVGVPKALELQNGLFIVNNAAVNLNLTTGNDYFPIPSSAGLEMRLGTANAIGGSGVALDGLLRVSGGTVNMAGGDNPIEYSASGGASLEVTGGTLTVGGQIRRSTSTDIGVLKYSQTGGTVVVGNNLAPINNRGVFEVLNSGSSFTMSGGNLYIARAQSNPTTPAFYFNPQTSSIGASANIHIGHTSTPAGQTIGIYAGKPLPQLRVNNSSGKNPTAKLETVAATISNLLLVDGGATFDANGVNLTLTGNMTVTGTYLPNGNTTFLSGTGLQTITGNGSQLNFYNLDKTGSNQVSLNSGNTPLLISNSLFLRNGTFTDNSNTISVHGDVLNNANHIYGGSGDGVLLNGSSPQTISGNGTFGKLTLNNPRGISMSGGSELQVANTLKMQAGVLNIGSNLLHLGVNTVIEEASTFSPFNMVETNMSFIDKGLRKVLPSGSSNFIFPVGSGSKYTPVTFNITANSSSTGSITVIPANEIHPSIVEDDEVGLSIVDKNNALKYFWNVRAEGISGFTATALMEYNPDDVLLGTEGYTIANYHPASLLNKEAYSWLKFPQSDFLQVSNEIRFTFTGKDDSEITGDYTAGAGDGTQDGAIPNQVQRYETLSNGLWTTGEIWSPNVSGGPHGGIAQINTAHIVNVPNNNISVYMTEVYGRLNINQTYGHRLGIVRGIGTLYFEGGDIPAAVYDNFVSSAGGTFEFGGSTNYEFLGNIFEVNHLRLSGSGQRRFPNNNITLNGNLTITGTASAINSYNRRITIKGNMTRTSGSFSAGTGPNATLVFNGLLNQAITGTFTGSNAINNLEVNNPNDLSIVNNIDINGQLLLTNGLINVPSGTTFKLNYSSTVTPLEGSSASFINGPCTKELINGNSFTFPIGNYNDTKAYGPIALQSVSGPSGFNNWRASYFYANPPYNTEQRETGIATVSTSEYWQIVAPTGGSSIISIYLNGSSNVANTIVNLSDLRLVGWNATSEQWEIVGAGTSVSGTPSNGRVTTTQPVNYGSYSYFTLASVVPVDASTATITSPANVNLCSGSSTTISVAFTGEAPYILTYNVGSNPVTTDPINTPSYSFSVSPSSTTVYSLISVTANGTPGTITGITSVTVNVSPIPTVTLSNSPVSPICQNQNITFTANSGLNSYQFRLNGVVEQSGSSNTYSTTLQPGTQSVDVIGTNTGGCSATSSARVITVNPLPEAASVISGSPSVCLGATRTYTIPSIANATEYVWSAPGTSGTSSTNSINLTFISSGTTTITVYGRNSCGNGVSATFDVAVSSSAEPGDAGGITGYNQVCAGGTSYAFSLAPVTNATSYVWSYSGTGATVNGTGREVTISFASDATSGNLTVYGTNGCDDGGVSPAYAIIVNPAPGASISPLDPSTCSGTNVVITATPSGGSGTYTAHAWSGTGSGWLSPTNTAATTFNGDTGGDYTLIYSVTDNRGCVGTASTSISVAQAPVAFSGNDALELCSGTSPIVMTGATASFSYSGTPTWSGAGGTWTQNPNPSLAIFTPSTPSGSTTARLTLTGANGCNDVWDEKEISWSVAPSQPGIFTESSINVCRGAEGVVYTIPIDPLASTYNWSYTNGGTGATINGSGNSVTVDFSSTATSGRLNVVATNSCGSSIARTLDVVVNPTPSIDFTIDGDANICDGDKVAFNIGYSINGGTGFTINILKDGSLYKTYTNLTVPTENPFTYITEELDWIPGVSPSSTFPFSTTIINTTTSCSGSSVAPVEVTVWKRPETGPQYHIPNSHGL